MPRSHESDAHTRAPSDQSRPTDYARVAQEYDTYLSGFVAGDHGRVELGAGELRPVVRDHLQAAARRRDLALRFRPGRGPLIFYVERAPVEATAPAATPPATPPAPRPAMPAPLPAAEPPRPSRTAHERPARPQQQPRPTRQPAAGRYDDLLPRWMREGQQAGQRRNPRPKRRRP